MLNYVNSIFCAYNEIEKNIIIKMRQEIPADPMNNSEPESLDIASVVMSKELALKLIENINNLFNNNLDE